MLTRFRVRVRKWVAPIQALMVPNGCFHGLSSNTHNVRLLLQTLLHGIDDGFMLPPFDATLLTGRALRLHRAARAVAGPIVAQGQPVLDVVKPPGQPLPGWAAILVVFDDVDKVLLTEATLDLGT